MFSSAEKISHHSLVQQNIAAGKGSFLHRKGEDAFFSEKSKNFFDSPAQVSFIQPKLTVSSPDDPQEKEADAMAEQVMRMPESSLSVSNSGQDIQAKEEEEEVQPKSEETYQTTVFAKSDEEEERVQAKLDLGIQRKDSETEGDKEKEKSFSEYQHLLIDRKPEGSQGYFLQRQGRGPPAADRSFEQVLSSSKGSGSPLPDSTRTFMETRFNADFSGVRIHTGSTAIQLSRDIHAHAFTHGNDIYFNAGKYNPASAEGGALLAHELTHTLQQGASKLLNNTVKPSASLQAKPVNRKAMLQRKAAPPDRPRVSNLEAAVNIAKGEAGKVDAGKTGVDGLRIGWNRLVDYFQVSLGADKVLSEGAPYKPGSVSIGDIKKKRVISGMKPNQNDPAVRENRDAMPSWCGIFVFWALNKAGIPMNPWVLGKAAVSPSAAYPPGYSPRPGDIAYRNKLSHYAMVVRSEGNEVVTINGNTAGNDNLGGQIQERTDPLKNWTAFFDPLFGIDTNKISTPAFIAPERNLTFRELRREIFLQRKADVPKESHEESELSANEGGKLQTKPELSDWTVNSSGILQKSTESERLQQKSEEAEKEVSEKEEPINRSAQEFGVHRYSGSRFYQIPSAESALVKAKSVSGNENAQISRHTEPCCQSNIISGAGLSVARGPPSVSAHSLSLVHTNQIQRSWLDDAWNAVSAVGDWISEGLEAGKRRLLQEIRDFVQHVPGYRALRVVLGEDPITGEEVQRNGHNFIEAAFDIIPGGRLLHQKLTELGALTEAENWVDGRLENIRRLVAGVVDSIGSFINRISLDSLANPRALIDSGTRIIRNIISNVVTFAENAASELLSIVKRFLLTQIVAFIRERTTAYPLLRVVLGQDPVTGEEVPRNGTNILNAMLELSEEGREQRRQMQETGTFQRVADWIDTGIAVFSNAYTQIVAGFNAIWGMVSIESLMQPVQTFQRIYNLFAGPVGKVLGFMAQTAIIILRLIKEALMSRLSAYARTVRGYSLLTVILGKDPFTDQHVPRTVENIIRGFMSLMEGGEEQFNQLQQTGAIQRTVARINAAVARLNMTPAAIIQLFIDLWNSLSLRDLSNPVAAFRRIMARFGEPIGRLIAFVVQIVRIVVEVVLQVMNFPTQLIANIISKAMIAFDLIKRDPVGFLKNLLRAIKQGFVQFFRNIGVHLLSGLQAWLMSELRDAGVRAPTDFTLRGVIGWVLEILGISMERIWQKLAEHPRIGPERVARIRSMIDRLEGIWTFIRDVQQRGIAAIWERIQERLSNLWDTVLEAIKNWIMQRVINQMVTRLLSMLDPTGIMAVINSAMALYRAIQSFIRYLRQMLEIVNSFVEGTVQIASGNISVAADFLERTLARGIPIVIGFLANQVGLSGLGRRIAEMLERVRGLVDRALTWLVDRAVNLGGRLLEMGRNAAGRVMGWLGLRKRVTVRDNETHTLYFDQGSRRMMMASTPVVFRDFVNSINIPSHNHARLNPLKLRIQGYLQQIDNLIANTTMSENTRTNQIEALLNEVGPLIARLIRETSGFLLTSEPPQYGGLHGGFGSSMRVRIVNGSPATTGSAPSSSLPASPWDDLRKRKTSPGSSDTYYIRAHLLNAELGGPGNIWSNLSILTQNANNRDWYSLGSHETTVETRVKRLRNEGKSFIYIVTANYGRSLNTSLLASIPGSGLSPARQADLQSIINAERFVPTSFVCTIQEIEPSTGGRVRNSQHDTTISVPNPINNQSLSDYHL